MKTKRVYIYLGILTLFTCWFFVCRNGMFASKTDWISQHSVLTEYFRQQFYQTKELFPEFAANLGGGQNIYNFSYYGLYNPIILFSYLFPFLKMSDYLIAASFGCLMASVMLLYFWLKKHGFSAGNCFVVSLMFLLAGPMVFHSYRQIMFVDYMPFLCMAFLGVDRYFEKKKAGLFTAGVFLMILTSFYFSVGGIAALGLYGVCKKKRPPEKYFLVRFFLPVVTAVLASGILLVPTAYSLLNRQGNSIAYSWADLSTFDFSVSRFAYSGYGVGLTAEILTVLFLGFTYKDRGEKVLSAICLLLLTLPVVSWILNGGLYAREKALIPFLPVLLFLMALYLDKQEKGEISFKTGLMGHFLTMFWCLVSFFLFAVRHPGVSAIELFLYGEGNSLWIYRILLAERALSLAFFLLYQKRKLAPMLLLPSLACLAVFGTAYNENNGNSVEKSFYEQTTDLAWRDAVSDVLEQERGLYRLEQGGSYDERKADINRVWNERQWITSMYSSSYQSDYKQFCQKIFGTEQPFRNDMMQVAQINPLFRKLMGVKYVIEKEKDSGKYTVDMQEHTAPVIYATDKTISEEAYQKLSFPYTQIVFAKRAVVENMPKEKGSGVYPAGEDFITRAEISVSENENIVRKDGGYAICSENDIHAKLRLLEPEEAGRKERLLYIQFDVKNNRKHGDVRIKAAGIQNTLSARSHIYYNGNTTFTYVIKLAEGQKEADIIFGKGDYFVRNVRSFLGGMSVLSDETLYQAEFRPDWEMTKGNRISGEIASPNEGYMISSIPYDKGFEVFVDGTRVALQKVNFAFLGAAIGKGKHKIEILYHAPGMKLGKLLACIGVLLWLLQGFAYRQPRGRGRYAE